MQNCVFRKGRLRKGGVRSREDQDLGKLVWISSGVLQVWGVIADFLMQGNEMMTIHLSTESAFLLVLK